MKTLLLLLLTLTDGQLRAGTISGTVRAHGKEGSGGEAGSSNYSSRALKFAERVNYDDMHDFIVYIEGPVLGARLVNPVATIHQKDATFVPHILPIMVGTRVYWPNDDPIFHNIFSRSDAGSFDLGLYKRGESPKSVVFDQPGEIDVFCSIHSRMSCIILVLENPYFAMTDARGHYSITNVPPGQYTLVAWQERLPKDKRTLTVPPAGDVTGVNFTMGIKNLPKY